MLDSSEEKKGGGLPLHPHGGHHPGGGYTLAAMLAMLAMSVLAMLMMLTMSMLTMPTMLAMSMSAMLTMLAIPRGGPGVCGRGVREPVAGGRAGQAGWWVTNPSLG